MRVAIAEDDPAYAEELMEYLRRFGEENGVDIQATVFRNGNELVCGYRPIWDLLLLDIDMPELDGMSAAGRIRDQDQEVLIMFITNLAQYAVKGYEVEALDYVLKPVNYYALAIKLQKVQHLIHRKTDKVLSVRQTGGVRGVRISQLYYIEVYSHQLCYHTTGGDLIETNAQSLRVVEQELAGYGFARCHNCYLVNLRYVDSIRGLKVCVAGKELNISRNRRKDFLDALLDYTKGGEEG